ncbi:hypothetical protein [Alistipes sp.]|uniref:hypothetical protein n=1 Tax=Alistipes sp. TaxID=1872444 RepID=UPI0031FD03F3
MADKKKTGAEALGQTGQPTASPGAEAPKVETIEQLRSEKNVNRAVFAGVCAAEGWKPGKTVTEAEFLKAVERFNSAPMSGAVKKKEAGE